MTRAECEKKVLELLGQIEKVCNEYHPGISVCLGVNNGHRSVFSLEKEGDETYYLINAVRFKDGTVKVFDDDLGCEVYIKMEEE